MRSAIALSLLSRHSLAGAAESAFDEIIVTARKYPEHFLDVPIAVTQFTADWIDNHDTKNFFDYAIHTPNLSFNYGSGPTGMSSARTVAIRGIGGQNFMGTGSATGFYIDDTPLPSSIDPRVVDVQSIEVLKGPQGTLYGENSLSGNIQLITKKPSLTADSLSGNVDAGFTSNGGSPNGGGSIVANVVLLPQLVSIRVVMFGNHDAGYLIRTYPSTPNGPAESDPTVNVDRTHVADQGASTSFGGSVSGLLHLDDRFESNFRFMYQSTHDSGFQATFAPLPAFTPIHQMDRAFDVQPYADDRWFLASWGMVYQERDWKIVSSVSYAKRHAVDVEDATYGTQQILAGYYGLQGVPSQPFLWTGDRHHSQFVAEARLLSDSSRKISGQFGVYFAKAESTYDTPPTYAEGLSEATQLPNTVGPWPNDLLWTIHVPATQKDISIFGEADFHITQSLTLTSGLRFYSLQQSIDSVIDGYLNFGPTPSDPQDNSQSGISPKIALAFKPSKDSLFYISGAKGFRAGGAQQSLPFCALPTLSTYDITHLKSDTLWTYEAGIRTQWAQPDVLLSAALFHVDWQNFQQLAALPCGAFVSINGDAAKINGAEVEVIVAPWRRLDVRAGVGYENANVVRAGNLSYVGLSDHDKLPGIPALTASIAIDYSETISTGSKAFVSFDYSFTGESTSLLNAGAGAMATRPSYQIANARVGIRTTQSEIALSIRNLTDENPNLGDIGYNGYAQFSDGNKLVPVVATHQPLTVLLQLSHDF